MTIATCTDEKDGEIDSTDYGLLCVKGEVYRIAYMYMYMHVFYNIHVHVHCVHVLLFNCTGKEIISQGLSHTVAKGEKGKSSGEWRSVIEGALDLVIRMEKDRQDTLHKLGIPVCTCIYNIHCTRACTGVCTLYMYTDISVTLC